MYALTLLHINKFDIIRKHYCVLESNWMKVEEYAENLYLYCTCKRKKPVSV